MHDFEEIYRAPMFHEMLSKPPSFPERLVTYQMVKPPQDQANVQKLEISSSTSRQTVHIQVKQRKFEAIIFKLTAQKWLIATTIFNTLPENCLLDRQSKKSHVR